MAVTNYMCIAADEMLTDLHLRWGEDIIIHFFPVINLLWFLLFILNIWKFSKFIIIFEVVELAIVVVAGVFGMTPNENDLWVFYASVVLFLGTMIARYRISPNSEKNRTPNLNQNDAQNQ